MFAMLAVPTALWQASQARRAAYVDLFYSQSAHLFDCADALLGVVDERYRVYQNRTADAEEFVRPAEFVAFNTAWDRYTNCVRYLLAAFDRCGGDVSTEQLGGVWQVTHSIAFVLSQYVEEGEVDRTSEIGMFLGCLAEARAECELICTDKRVAAGAEHYQRMQRGRQ